MRDEPDLPIGGYNPQRSGIEVHGVELRYEPQVGIRIASVVRVAGADNLASLGVLQPYIESTDVEVADAAVDLDRVRTGVILFGGNSRPNMLRMMSTNSRTCTVGSEGSRCSYGRES